MSWQPGRPPLRGGECNIIAVHMPSQSHNHSHAVAIEPGFSLLRLSAPARVGFAALIVAVLWLATLAVIL